MDFVHELFLDGLDRYEAAGVLRLRQDKASLFTDFDNGIAQELRTGYVFPVVVVVSAGGLSAAFAEMACQNARSLGVPVVELPAEFVQEGRFKHSRISRTAQDDDVRAFFQAFDDRLYAVVDVGVDHLRQDAVDVFARIHVLHQDALLAKLGNLFPHVVAENVADLQVIAAGFDDFLNLFHAGLDVHAAGVGNDLRLLFRQVGQHALQRRNEIAGIACFGPFFLLTAHDGQSQFRQVIAANIIYVVFLRHDNRRVNQVSPKALAAADAYCLHRCTFFLS